MRISFKKVSLLVLLHLVLASSAFSQETHWLRLWMGGVFSTVAIKDPMTRHQALKHYLGQDSRKFYEWVGSKQSIENLIQEAGLDEYVGSIPSPQAIGPQQPWVDLPLPQVIEVIRYGVSKVSTEKREELISKIPLSVFEEISNQIRHEVRSLKIRDTPAIQQLLDPKTGFDLEEPMKSTTDVILSEYLESLDEEIRLQMISSLITLPAAAPIREKISVLLFHVGPALQKVFQLVGEKAKSEDVKWALKKLKDGIPPVQGEWIRRHIETRFQLPISQVFLEFNEKAAASGTIGQVHFATLHSGLRVAVKVRRPGVEVALENELKILLRITERSPVAHEVVKKIQKTLSDEIDFRKEAAYIEMGRVYESKKDGITLAKIPTKVSIFEDVLVTGRATGVPFYRVDPQYHSIQKKALQRLTANWFQEAIFGGGFFHGDLHGGNLFFDPTAGKEGQITLIDFGNSGMLTVAERRGAMRMAIASLIRDPDEMMTALQLLTSMPVHLEEAVRKRVFEIFSEIENSEERLNQVLPAAIGLGVEVPPSLVSFFRGKAFLEGQLRELDPNINIMRIYLKVAGKTLSKSLAKQLIMASERERATISWREVRMLGKTLIKNWIRSIGDCSKYLLTSKVTQ